jgi:hypothetical protein
MQSTFTARKRLFVLGIMSEMMTDLSPLASYQVIITTDALAIA